MSAAQTRSARRVLAGAGLALLALVLIGSVKAVTPPYAPQAPEYRTQGPADAPVTVAEFTDFQCPSCRVSVPEVKAVEAQFAGKVRVVFKHRPLKGHAWARETALAAECAGKAGKFWPMHDILYARQDAWAELQDAAEMRKLLLSYAREAGCDEAAVSACMGDAAAAAAVDSDAQEADGRRVNATPTFFINGKRFVGPLQLKTYGVNRIEDLLRKGRRAEMSAKRAVPEPAPQPAGPAGFPGAAARLLVGAVLLISGLEKAAMPPEEFAAVIQGYWLLPQSAHLPLALALPGAEVLVGLALVAGYLGRAASAAACGLFLAFIGALGSTLLRGIPLPDCGCFGRGVHLSVPQALGLDSALLCLSYLAYRKGAALSWLDRWVERGTP